MPLCGFKPKMIQGLALFSEGLFEATLERAEEEGISIEEAFQKEVKEIGLLLETLENTHQELKHTHSAQETMKKVVEVIPSS